MAQGASRPRHVRKISTLLSRGDSGRNPAVKYETSADEATIRYIEKVLCPEQANSGVESGDSATRSSLENLIPPLTSSNAVDEQLYAIIAVIISQFVQTWYNRITPDAEFVSEVIRIIAHCTRGVESRIRDADLEDLLLDELPALLERHVDAVRIARRVSYINAASPDDFRLVYHSLIPMTALAPPPLNDTAIGDQSTNEIAWSQLLVARILPHVLPPEDFANPCLHVLVSEIFSELIVRNALCARASEPWIIWDGITKMMRVLNPLERGNVSAKDPASRLAGFGLVPDPSEAGPQPPTDQHSQSRYFTQTLWMLVQFAALLWQIISVVASALMHESSIPARSQRHQSDLSRNKVRLSALDAGHLPSPPDPPAKARSKRPVLAMRVWTCISTLSDLKLRMPWLCGALSLLQWTAIHGPGKLCATNSALDRLMAAQTAHHLSRPDLLPSVLQATRSALFPHNALAAARVPPTAAELVEIKRECAKTIVQAIPVAIRNRYFATKDENLMREDVETTLELFADPYINKHFIVSAVELVAVRLFPELAEDALDE